MKEFKAESKRLLDLMINSIYTNKEIFLRELISNASDAIDKLYYKSLTEKNVKVRREDLKILLELDKNNKILTIKDNGIGMDKDELEKNLGTIARSGSFDFKKNNDKKEEIDIIGQFGVGFYSAFMVADKVSVVSKKYGEEKAYEWVSTGVEGYEIKEASKDENGTIITLHIKDDLEEEKYSEFLEEYTIQGLVKKYSDYVRYPINMEVTTSKLKEKKNKDDKDEYEDVKEIQTLNSMVPLWKKNKKDIKDEEYNDFYMNKFYDFEKPLKVIHTSLEGNINYKAILFIPSHLPFDFYNKEYEKGLQLYSGGVLIMEKCSDLLPDYFSFVKGVVDTEDVSLNISREMLQQDRVVKAIAKNIEKKIIENLTKMMEEDRDGYNKFFESFGLQLKFGAYNDYGMNKDKLKDLLLFYSSKEKKNVSLKEYVSRVVEKQDKIYYACGETIDKIDMLPQVELVKDKGYEILYLTENVDEFVFKVLTEYDSKKFVNVCAEDLDLDTNEEKENLKKANEENKDMLKFINDIVTEVEDVRFTHRLKNHPVCLVTEGEVSTSMEKVINNMPNDQKIKAKTVLEINENHIIANKLKDLYTNDKDKLKEYSSVLYDLARMIEGLPVDNVVKLTNTICDLISK